MLSFSSKVVYSISAMLELALYYQVKCLQIKEIAASQNIPVSYLEQILLTLKKAGLLQSIRGAQGGFKLNKEPSLIKIIDIIEAVEGKLCLTNTDVQSKVLNNFFEDCQKQISNIFETNLAELVLKAKTLENQTIYYI